jgi:hypothetical protein
MGQKKYWIFFLGLLDLEERGNTFLRNVGNGLQGDTPYHPTKFTSALNALRTT